MQGNTLKSEPANKKMDISNFYSFYNYICMDVSCFHFTPLSTLGILIITYNNIADYRLLENTKKKKIKHSTKPNFEILNVNSCNVIWDLFSKKKTKKKMSFLIICCKYFICNYFEKLF